MFGTMIPELGKAFGSRNKFRGAYKRTYGKSHLVICGGITFDTLGVIVKNFIHEDATVKKTDLVIIDIVKPSSERQAFFRRHFNDVTFIQGTVLDMSTLKLARIPQASAVLILADRRAADEDEEDTANIMRATAVKNHAPKIRIIIQLLQQHNKEQLFHIPSWSWHKSGGDEVVCISELKMGFMAQNCLAPGIVTMLSNLLTLKSLKLTHPGEWMDDYLYGAGHEIYSESFSPSFFGMTFTEAAEICFAQFGILLLAVNSCEDNKLRRRKLRVNPGDSLIIEDGQTGFFIAQGPSDARKVVHWKKSGFNNQLSSSSVKQLLSPRQDFIEPPDFCSGTEDELEFLGDMSNGCRRKKSLDGFGGRQMMPNGDGEEDPSEPELFDHTGNVHWCLARPLEDALLDADSVREHRLAGHVILVLGTARDSNMAPDTVCLANFLAPLRASSIHARELKPVVIHADGDFIQAVWASIANFPKIFFYPSTRSMHADLRSLNIQRCAMCVVLAATERSTVDETAVDRHAVLTTMNILSLQKLEEKIGKIGVLTNPEVFRKQIAIENEIPLLIGLEHDQSVAYIDDDDDDDPTLPVYQTTPYVCGRVLLSSVLDCLVTTAFINSEVLQLIRALITGGESSDFERMLADDVGVVRKTTLTDVTHARKRSSLALLALAHGLLEKINHQFEYGQLVKGALRTYGILCLGVYRLIDLASKDPRNRRRYVITSPPYTFKLFPSDRIYTLKPFDAAPSRGTHLSSTDSEGPTSPVSPPSYPSLRGQPSPRNYGNVSEVLHASAPSGGPQAVSGPQLLSAPPGVVSAKGADGPTSSLIDVNTETYL